MRRLVAGLLCVAGCAFTPGMEEPSNLVPEVRFAFAESITDETVGTTTVFVELSIPAPAVVTVDLVALEGASAQAGTDFTLPSGQVRFEIGQRSAEVPIGIVGDNLAELDETVSLELRNPTGATLGEARTHDLKISANILPRISFATGTLALAENIASQPFPVQLDTASDSDVLFAYSVTGTATLGVDHNLSSSDSARIPRGMTTISINAPILNDGTDEEDETIDVALTALSGAVVGQNRTRQHTILDEDLAPNVGFAAATSTTAETGTVTITVNLAAVSAKTASVSYAVNAGSATTADFTATSGTLTFPPGTTSQTFTVAITEDAIDEPDETFTIALANLVNTSAGGILNHDLTITDDDTATIQFQNATSTTDEDDGGLRTVRLTLSTPSSQSVGFSIATSGTATRGDGGGDDYQIPAGPFSIPAGATTFDLQVTVRQTFPMNEDDETAVFTLSNPSNVTIGSPGVHTMTIRE